MTIRLRLVPLLFSLPLAACSGILPSRGVSASALMAAAPPPVDSAEALATARSAQARFERLRVANLPWTTRVASAPRCDEIVGRFCLWFDAPSTPWEPLPEDEQVRRAREGLIVWLDSAGAVQPRDPWIIGQRIRYLVEAKRYDEAESAASSCVAERWWCVALGAFVLHSRGNFADAEAAFETALHAMPDSTQSEWTDLSILLERHEREAYARLDTGERAAFERRFWRLANPLASQPGNARRTEHFTRHVFARLFEDSRSPNRDGWSWDSRELLLRYGTGVGWERAMQSSLGGGGETSIITHYAPGGRTFLPPAEMVTDPGRLDTELLLERSTRPRTEFAPSFTDSFHALRHQVGMFRRGDSVIVAAVWEFPADSLSDTAQVETAIVLSTLDGETIRIEREAHRGRRGIVLASSSSRAMLASVEVLAPDERKAGRARTAVRPAWRSTDRVSLSDMLLVDFDGAGPSSLEEALAAARSSWTVQRNDRVGIYWELYAADTASRRAVITLSLVREGRGWARRLAERLGLRDGAAGLRLDWEEQTQALVVPRVVALDLSRIEPGTYTLELRIGGQGTASARRRIVITK